VIRHYKQKSESSSDQNKSQQPQNKRQKWQPLIITHIGLPHCNSNKQKWHASTAGSNKDSSTQTITSIILWVLYAKS
jgi:hypothetical protein